MTTARLRGGWGLAAALVIGAVALALIRLAGPPIYCGDGFFHIKYAEILRTDGISRSFTWFTEAIQRETFANFNLLYHVLLIPFTLGDLGTGARIAGIVGGALAVGAFFVTLRTLEVPAPLTWTVLLLGAAPELLYRLTYTRPFVLSLALCWLGTAAVLTGRYRAAAVVAFLWSHLHISFHVLPAIALAHDALRNAPDEHGWRRFRTTLWTCGGVALGLLLSPYFPHNLRFWKIANFGVIGFAWTRADDARFATEMVATRTDTFLLLHLGAFVASGLAVMVLAWTRKVSDQARTLLLVALGFFALSLTSQRFAEHWAPFSFLLLAVLVRDVGLWRGALRWGVAVLAVVLLVLSVRVDRAAAAEEEVDDYATASAWMSDNVPAGEILFHPAFDEVAPLFFHDTRHRFLSGMDPTFFLAADRDRFALWGRVVHGQVQDAWEPIHQTFHCRWVFLPNRFVSLRRLLERDPRFVERYRDPQCGIYSVADDPGYLGDWTIRGWYPDPTRTWLAGDIPKDAGNEVVLRGVSGFLDLRRALGIPPDVRDVCAVAETRIPSTPGTAIALELATDDEVQLTWDAGPGASRLPYSDPPPPMNLADLGKPRTGPPFLRLEGTASQPSTPVRVATCQVGDDFGFVLLEP